jgi:hypothetical protein
MNRTRKKLVIWSVFAGVFLLLLILIWYLFHIEPAGRPDYSLERRQTIVPAVQALPSAADAQSPEGSSERDS